MRNIRNKIEKWTGARHLITSYHRVVERWVIRYFLAIVWRQAYLSGIASQLHREIVVHILRVACHLFGFPGERWTRDPQRENAATGTARVQQHRVLFIRIDSERVVQTIQGWLDLLIRFSLCSPSMISDHVFPHRRRIRHFFKLRSEIMTFTLRSRVLIGLLIK